jgi:hypothetical protein
MEGINKYPIKIKGSIFTCIFRYKRCGLVQVTHQHVYISDNVDGLYLSREVLVALQMTAQGFPRVGVVTDHNVEGVSLVASFSCPSRKDPIPLGEGILEEL